MNSKEALGLAHRLLYGAQSFIGHSTPEIDRVKEAIADEIRRLDTGCDMSFQGITEARLKQYLHDAKAAAMEAEVSAAKAEIVRKECDELRKELEQLKRGES